MERREFFGLDKRELVDKVDKVLEAGVEMRLCAQEHNVLEVCMVDVRVNTEQALEDHLDDRLEVAREGDT